MPLTIPGVATIHERVVWTTDRQPVTGPAMNASAVDVTVAHYAAAGEVPDGDYGEQIADIVAWLRSVHNFYLTSKGRGYSIGYNFLVDWLGGVWVLRGFDFKNAANKDHNGHTVSVLILTDRDEPASALAWASARAIAREVRRRSGRAALLCPTGQRRPTERMWGHNELRLVTGRGTQTSCCGAGLYGQLFAGLGDLDHGAVEVAPDPGQEAVTVPVGYGLWPLNPDKVTIRNGDRGDAVTYLQQVMVDHAGQAIAVDGRFGPQTEGAVRNVQHFFGVDADGIVGPVTWPLIDLLAGHAWPTPPAPVGPPPPPTTGPPASVRHVDQVCYRVQPGDGWWRIGVRLYGDGNRGIRTFGTLDVPQSGQVVAVPDMPGFGTVAQRGEGALAVIRRLAPGVNPHGLLARFHDLNGGPTRILAVDDPVWLDDGAIAWVANL